MLDITVNSNSKVRREFIAAVCSFYAQELKILNRARRVMILSENQVTTDFGHNGSVFMLPDDDTVYMLINSRLSMEKLMLTLAHEMVHVKQYLTGIYRQRVDGDEVVHYWRGKVYPEVQYFDRPWEIQALREEKFLATRVWAKIGALQQL